MRSQENPYNEGYDDTDPMEDFKHFVSMIKDSPINYRKNSDYSEKTNDKKAVCCCYDLRGFSMYCVEQPEKAKEVILKLSHEYVELTFDDQCDYYKLLGDGLLVVYDESVLLNADYFLKKIEIYMKGIETVLLGKQYPRSIAGAISYGAVVEYEISGGRPCVQYKDYFGYPINAACRLQGLANSGELVYEYNFLEELKRQGIQQNWNEEDHTSSQSEYFKGIKNNEKIIGRRQFTQILP